jgi:O-antigen/teichoic acid export membrane protein
MSELQDTRRRLHRVLLRQSALSFVARVGGALLAFVVTFVLARTYGPAVYGEFRMVVAMVAVAGTCSSLGTGAGLLKFIPRYTLGKGREVSTLLSTAAIVVLTLSLPLSLTLYFGRDAIASRLLGAPELGDSLGACALILALLPLIGVVRCLYTAHKKPVVPTLMIQIVLRLLFIGGATMLYARGRMDAASLCSAYGVAHLLVLSVLLIDSRRFWVPHLKHFSLGQMDIPLTRRFMQYALVMVSAGLVHTLLNRTDTIMLGILGSSTKVGIYHVAFRISSLTELLSLSMAGLLASTISDLWSRGDKGGVVHLCNLVTTWFLALMLPLVMTFIFFAEPILSCFGSHYLAGAPALKVLAGSRLIAAFSVAGAAPLLAVCGMERVLLVRNVSVLLANVALNAWLIPRYGVTGAAGATLICRFISAAVCLFFARQLLGCSLLRGRLLPFGACFIISCLICGLAHRLSPTLGMTFVALGLAAAGSLVVTAMTQPGGLRRHLVLVRRAVSGFTRIKGKT